MYKSISLNAFKCLIIGAPGSGKGTISSRLIKDFPLAYVASGDLLRSHVENKTKIGLEANQYMKKGDFVPDKLVTEMILSEIQKLKNKNFLLDGYPRTVDQALYLDETDPIDCVLNLNIPQQVIIDRIKHRWTHLASGRVYNLEFNPPRLPGFDDITGEPLQQREDDKEETVRARLQHYQSLTEPVIDHYKNLILSQIHVEGKPDEMKSSPIRRAFCLLVLFDLILCVLVWIFHVEISNKSKTRFREEVIEYKFNNSLFDTVILAAVRFTFLEVMYGGIKSMLPWWIALSTTTTSGFVICKMFMHLIIREPSLGFTPRTNEYIIILISFIICWVETIFLVYRVLPKEKAAEQIEKHYRSIVEQYGGSSQSLPSNISNSFEQVNRLSPATSVADIFFSPITTRPASPTHIRIKELKDKAADLQERAWEISRNGTGWTFVTGDAVQGCVTHKEMISYKGKIFKVETLLNVSAKILYNDMVNNCEQSPAWNPHVRLVRKIEHISDNVDIIYNVSNEALRGYISPRDFVLLRTWTTVDQCYLISMTSIIHDDYPHQRDIVRGEYGIGVIMLENSRIDTNQCKCIWIMNNDIKGNLFKSVVDRAVPGILLEIIASLRRHCTTLMIAS